MHDGMELEQWVEICMMVWNWDSGMEWEYDHPFPSQVMKVLQQLIPESVCPYSLLLSHRFPSSQMITTLAFKGNDVLISGCRDCHVSPQTALLHVSSLLSMNINGGSLSEPHTSVTALH